MVLVYSPGPFAFECEMASALAFVIDTTHLNEMYFIRIPCYSIINRLRISNGYKSHFGFSIQKSHWTE